MGKAVINGATGTIGMALIERLLEEEVNVLVLGRMDSTRISRILKDPRIKVDFCDLNELGAYQNKTREKYDVFYHFAWAGAFGDTRNDMLLQSMNIRYTIDAVRLAKRLGCHTFIGAGSQAEYGRVEGMLSPSTPTFPENGYGMAKLCAGQMSRVLCSQLGMKHIWVRILSVYGPYDSEKTMIMTAISKLLQGEAPEFTNGEQRWDYLYCEDAANAFSLLKDKGKDGQIYCLGSGKTKPLAEYITMLKNTVNNGVSIKLGAIPYADKQVMHLCADISELSRDTGFKPDVTFEQGIKKTVDWMKARIE